MRDAIGDAHSWFDTAIHLRKDAVRKGIPLAGGFEITARCNLACAMCYARREGSKEILDAEKSAKNWIEMGKQAAAAGTLFLLITGGEPLIRSDFREIYEGLNGLGLIISLFTNATLIDKGFIEWMAKMPPNSVGVTLYGASPETYKQVTGDADAYRKTLRGLDLLLNAGFNVRLRTTITRKNLADLAAMETLAKERDLVIQPVYMLMKPVRGAASAVEALRLSPQELGQHYKRVYGQAAVARDISITTGQRKPVRVGAMNCAAGRCSYWLAWDGKMYPCALMDSPFSEPFRSGFVGGWQQLKSSIEGIMGPDECQDCEYRSYCIVCPARLQQETGSFKALSPYICGMAKMVKEELAFSGGEE